MFRKAKNLIKRLRGRRIPDLIYIVSYPKCGRTWLRALLGKYFSLKHAISDAEMLAPEFFSGLAGLPKLVFTHDQSALVDHLHYKDMSYDLNSYKGAKVLLLGRDIKDTVVSSYFQATKRVNVFEGTITDFIRSETYGVMKLVTFYDIWNKNKDVPKALLYASYEEMHTSPEQTLLRILSFIGEQNPDTEILKQSIAYCDFNNLKKIEQSGAIKTEILRPGDAQDPESFKVRKGQVGGYKEYLNQDDEDYIDELISKSRIRLDPFHRTEI